MNLPKLKYVFVIFCFSANLAWGNNVSELWTKISNLEQQGEFSKTSTVITDYLNSSKKLSSKEKSNLEFEIDRLNRIRLDYKMTEDSLFDAIQKDMPDFTQSEMRELENKGYFDTRVIDGEKRYFNSSKSNLFMRYPEFRKRRINQDTSFKRAETHWQMYEAVKAEGEKSTTSFVLPQKYHMTMTITVDKDAVPDGKTIKCWMPFPRKTSLQKDIQYISSEPSKHILAPADAPMRSIYLEKKAKAGEPTVFKAEYEYTCYSRWLQMDPRKVKPYNKKSAEYKKWTEERPPNIFFSNDIKELSKKIVGKEKNPYWIARKIYNWISDNSKYSYAPEYSTIPSQSAFCLEKGYGDCGQHSMLFITLCRYNGIPARWQTGWFLPPNGANLHDWSEIYLEPYGWVPVDSDIVIWMRTWAEKIGDEKAQLLKDFYFGSIDNWRLIANGDFGRDFTPKKKSFRSDTVDFQRAELECGGKNIYFDQFDYHMDVQRL